MVFSSVNKILNYPYQTRLELYEALSALERMYAAKKITEIRYLTAKGLLENKLRTLKR